jgi:alpha-L-fucosidase 2
LLEIERLGMGMWVGFSYAMNAQIYAMAEKGNSAYEKLRMFCNGFVADNGFHLNGDFKNYGYTTFHYRPFTLESLFGYCDAVNEMLLQDHMGYIHAFAAIPELWKKGKISFTDLRSRGGVLVSAKACGGVTEQMRLKSKRGMQVRIKNTFGVGQVCVQTSKGSYTLHDTDGYFVLDISRGQTTLSAI